MTHSPPSAIARQWAIGTKINSLVPNADGTLVAAALGDGRVAVWAATDDAEAPKLHALHDGVSLALAPCGVGFVSGGDDGKVVVFGQTEVQTCATQKGRWIDQVAATADGSLIAYAYGKNLQLISRDGAPQGIAKQHASSIGGLAFSPNGKRVAASHNNGVSLWWTAATSQTPVALTWKGSHLLTCWSPDGKIVLTAMQENALHGWRLSDMNEMRMQGYAGKIRTMDWSPKGRYLVTAGAGQAICWPFFGGGPWGKQPLALGIDRGILVRCTAAHPRDELVAIGYEDGMIELAPLDERPSIMIHPPVAEKDHAVTGLAWNGTGTALFAATQDGYVMLFTLDSVAAAVKQ